MKQSQSKRLLGLTAALSLAVLLLFQNCSEVPEEKKDNASLGDSLPFPFETDIDTISYMSCSRTGSNANPRAYFTFRVGAYQTGGIGLTSGFLSQTSGASQRSDILQATTTNAGSFLQLAIRQRNQYQTALGGSGGVQEGYHYYNFLDTLNSPVLGDRLGALTSSQKVNYFAGVSGLEGKLVEGSLRFFDGETQSGEVRNYLLNDMVLAMTYSHAASSEPYTARAPDITNPSRVFGKGYKVNFRLAGVQSSGINRLLQSVTEINLETGANIKTWTSCSSSDSYVIVRAQDVPGACSASADPVLAPTHANYNRLQRIRRVLRVEDWWVDLARGCVVPKNNPNGGGGACYGTGSAAQTTIQYAVGASGSGVTTCDVNTCPHYVSVCTR